MSLNYDSWIFSILQLQIPRGENQKHMCYFLAKYQFKFPQHFYSQLRKPFSIYFTLFARNKDWKLSPITSHKDPFYTTLMYRLEFRKEKSKKKITTPKPSCRCFMRKWIVDTTRKFLDIGKWLFHQLHFPMKGHKRRIEFIRNSSLRTLKSVLKLVTNKPISTISKNTSFVFYDIMCYILV